MTACPACWKNSCLFYPSLFSRAELHWANLPSMWKSMDCIGSTLG